MDREVILRVGDDEISLGFVSDFLLPRDGNSMMLSVFSKISEAIESIDLDSCEIEPIVFGIL